MRGRRWLLVAGIGAGTVLIAFLLDVVVDLSINESTAGALGVVVIVAAVLVAGACYQRWSTVDRRHVPEHVMAATGLIGGALVASSAFEATGTDIFGSTVTATLGTASVLVALVAAQMSLQGRDAR